MIRSTSSLKWTNMFTMSFGTIMNDKWEIRTNDKSHRGLFATEKISQGQTVCNLPSNTVDRPDKYSIQVYPGIHIDCESSPAGVINHSCDPNAVVWKWQIVAWKCLEPGDEITINYSITEDEISSPFKCECGHCKEDTWIKW